ncbi:NAD-dependent deacetylase sirtuin-6 [Fusarium albosuccineum]|uniref:protein acetyllysine N-acetyltransferase n=1 Tax=Fusarium albosuccineum TaxID=1237068 RepID=A0A8H4KS94_9HYPO|nr:NAD-dependent deacetylase sirtuin-6 [Fusarium albosuccineum]
MANTAPKVPLPERRDAPEVIDQQAAKLVNLINKSKHFVVFTGAGVSTSAGIPDFRGPEGAWTLRAQGRARTTKAVSTLQAIPTPSHMALLELQNRGVLKYLVSQNCDGLHRRSGIRPEMISELHGNSNRECCRDCGKEYIRDFRAVATYEKTVRDHRTGRKCTRCGGVLHDSIINFGENLPEEALKLARDHAEEADLCLVLGSSLTVTPANEIPEVCGARRSSKLVICNLQKTSLNSQAHMHVYCEADALMTRVMAGLGLPIPTFILKRRLVVKTDVDKNERQVIALNGIDVDGTPVSYLRSVKLEYNRRVARSEPFTFNFRDALSLGMELKFELEFMGHYNEPNLVIDYQVQSYGAPEAVFDLHYDPSTGEWMTMRE